MIAGLDEVGRGPWAGPVVSAAVILDLDNVPDDLNDSKKLTREKREVLFEAITETACAIAVGVADVQRIDATNILAASLWSMSDAMRQLSLDPTTRPVHALVDGNQEPPELSCTTELIVGGDARSASIAAASIIAKVTRDRMMTELAVVHPQYGWESNVGYGTKAHREGLANFGVTAHHRRSFAPIRKLLAA